MRNLTIEARINSFAIHPAFNVAEYPIEAQRQLPECCNGVPVGLAGISTGLQGPWQMGMANGFPAHGAAPQERTASFPGQQSLTWQQE